MKLIMDFVQSIGHAWRGCILAFKTERSFRVQMAMGMIVVVLVIILPLRDWERIILLLATAMVLVLELLNSTVERLVDLVKPGLHQYARDIKDLMAAAVLIASFFALIIGVLVVVPYLNQLIGRV